MTLLWWVTVHTVQYQTAVHCFWVLCSQKNSSKLLELHFSLYLIYILQQNTSKLPVYSLVTLTLQSQAVTICTTTFDIQKFCILPTQCIYVCCVDLRTNSHYFPIQHYLTGFYNWDGVCLLRSTDCILLSFKALSSVWQQTATEHTILLLCIQDLSLVIGYLDSFVVFLRSCVQMLGCYLRWCPDYFSCGFQVVIS